MANRYENIEILRTELGKRYKKTTRYPKMDRILIYSLFKEID